MTVFEQKDQLETETTVEAGEDGSYLNKLVAARGEQWKDPEVLAKGKLEADTFIENLKAENQKLREMSEQAKKIDDLLAKLEQRAADPGASQMAEEEMSHKADQPMSAFSEEDISSLIEKRVSEIEQTKQRQQNIESVDRVLREKFGDSAQRVLASRAAELGMSMDEMKDIAASKPKAFMRLAGLDGTAPKADTGTFGNNVNTASTSSNANRRDWNYYQNLRRESKAKYYTTAVQNQMLRDINDMGADKFYGRA